MEKGVHGNDSQNRAIFIRKEIDFSSQNSVTRDKEGNYRRIKDQFIKRIQ
jgi:hypothetical protein